MQQISDRLQKELEALNRRLQELAKAQQGMHGDVEKALAELQKQMLEQNAELSARDLAALREFMAALRQELKRLEANQGQLMQANEQANDRARAELSREQSKLEKDAERPLAQTRELQNSEKLKKMRRRIPKLPNAPYTPDTDEEMVPPKEEDTDEPDASRATEQQGKAADKDKQSKDDQEEPLYMPALGGPRPKVDPRFAKKLRPSERRAKNREQSGSKEEMADRQGREQAELNAAEQSLGSDQDALDRLLQQLQQATRPGQNAEGSEHSGAQESPNLSKMMQSPAMQQALQMAARMRSTQAGKSAMHGSSQSLLGNLQGGPRDGPALAAELGKLDLATQDLIMKLQPKLREELLQGMHEEGPEGYRKFIQDYFRRLSKEKSAK
jgi:hypothetical protein